jgi:hypothetical protein
MEANKPIIEQISDSVPSGSDITSGAKGFSEGVTNSIASAQEGVQSGLEDFSKSANLEEAGNDFLSANGLLAKFVFIVLVLVAFMILMKVGIAILGYMLGPWSNPYLIKGSLGGSTGASIKQNPRDENSAIIMRSNDRNKGIEFTWSVWLFINQENDASTPKNIFVKGDSQFDGTTKFNLLNGPGLYLQDDTATSPGTYKLVVKIDTMNDTETAEINGVPINKWFHVAIRMQNKVMDTYVNGVVTDRFNLPSLPKQNFNNVTIHGNNGYSGSTSNLRYYNYALNVFEINNIVMFGPDLSPSSLSADSKALSGNYSFLASSWYGKNYNM